MNHYHVKITTPLGVVDYVLSEREIARLDSEAAAHEVCDFYLSKFPGMTYEAVECDGWICSPKKPLRLVHGDCLEMLRYIENETIDSLVTDPPAGISFMGQEWDDDKGGRDAWVKWLTAVMREVWRVLKPGPHGLVWALPKTSHWTMLALENAGFEIRDVINHVFGSGMPHGRDVSKAIVLIRQMLTLALLRFVDMKLWARRSMAVA